MAQKIVIPKGTINPGETTVIEIPQDLQGSSVVIAKSKDPANDTSFDIRQSFLDGSDADFGLSESVMRKARNKFPNLFESPAHERKWMPYARQPEDRTPPHYEGAYDSQIMGNASWSSQPRNDVVRTPVKRPHGALPMLPYPKDFSPDYRSSPYNRERWTAKDYVYNEDSFMEKINRRQPDIPLYGPGLVGPDRHPDIQYHEEAGAGENPLLHGASQVSADPGFSTSVHEKMQALDQTEYVEQWQILADLRMYQHTRRKLIYDICNMGTGSVTSKSKMSKIMAPIKSVFAKKGKYWVNPYA